VGLEAATGRAANLVAAAGGWEAENSRAAASDQEGKDIEFSPQVGGHGLGRVTTREQPALKNNQRGRKSAGTTARDGKLSEWKGWKFLVKTIKTRNPLPRFFCKVFAG